MHLNVMAVPLFLPLFLKTFDWPLGLDTMFAACQE